MNTFTLDIAKVRELSRELPENGRRFREQFEELRRKVRETFGVELPEHLRRTARDMYQEIRPSTPYILEVIVAEIINQAGMKYEKLVIQNPEGMYNICVGLGRAGIAVDTMASVKEKTEKPKDADGEEDTQKNLEWKLDFVEVQGDVGTFYGGLSARRYIEHHIKGNAGRSFMDNAQQGRVILEGVADDSAAQVNHGAYFLFKNLVGPRLAWAQRGGSVVTLRNLPYNAGMFMAGGEIIGLGEEVDDDLGPDMQEGRIYTPKVKRLFSGTAALCLGEEDYVRIASALGPFAKELDIGVSEKGRIDTTGFNAGKPVLSINGMDYDFSKYFKIVPERLAPKKEG